MILKLKKLQTYCKKIAEAFASKTTYNNLLQIKAEDNKLFMNVADEETYISVCLNSDIDICFNTTIQAKLFLNLISKLTAEDVELFMKNNVLIVKCNGLYKFPAIETNSGLVSVEPINIDNKTVEFDINSSNLLDIYTYNSKELFKGQQQVRTPLQTLYYLDQDGCITFTTGACVNNFHLEQPINLLLSPYIIKLCKLFDKEEKVHLTLGQDDLKGKIVSKLNLHSDNISISALLQNDLNLLAQYPYKAIRNKVEASYPYTVDLNVKAVVESLNRIALFMDKTVDSLKFRFETNELVIETDDTSVSETIPYLNSSISSSYVAYFKFKELTLTLSEIDEQFTSLCFGNQESLLIKRGNISILVPEVDRVD